MLLGGGDGAITVYNFLKGTMLRTLPSSAAAVTAMAYSAEDKVQPSRAVSMKVVAPAEHTGDSAHTSILVSSTHCIPLHVACPLHCYNGLKGTDTFGSALGSKPLGSGFV